MNDMDLKTIEDWKKELKTKDHIFAGMVVANNFGAGKQLSQKEYEEAINFFLYGKKDEKIQDKSKTTRKRKNENMEAVNEE
jgi:hypothetical protein